MFGICSELTIKTLEQVNISLVSCLKMINPFQPNVTFFIENSDVICNANQMTGSYIKCNTGLKWISYIVNRMARVRLFSSKA